MKNHTMCITNFLLIFISFTAAYADTLKQSRADSHAPIGVMGDHGRKIGEMMLAYRFMAMDMRDYNPGRLLLRHLNPNMSPSHRPDVRRSTRLDFAVSSNLIIPTGILTGQKFAIEFQMPLYQNLAGAQLKTIWHLTIGWQYGFKAW